VTPLVLVHGFIGGSAQWDTLRAALSSKVDLVAIDLPGFGRNAHLPAIDSIEGFADWVIEELRGKGIDHYHLLGHSMGGMIAQEMAMRDSTRVNRLILYATGAVGVLPGRFETIAESKRRAAEDGAGATARRITATWFLERDAADVYDACARIAECADLRAIQAGLDAMQKWSGQSALSAIEQDTLIVWGDKDRTYAWDQTHTLWTGIARCQLAVVPGCAHAIHLEKPDMFTALLVDFLSPERSPGH